MMHFGRFWSAWFGRFASAWAVGVGTAVVVIAFDVLRYVLHWGHGGWLIGVGVGVEMGIIGGLSQARRNRRLDRWAAAARANERPAEG